MFSRQSKSAAGNRSQMSNWEPESSRLQRDMEHIIQKLEQEKRQTNFLEEQIKISENEIKEQKERAGQSFATPESKLRYQVTNLTKQLELQVAHLNQARAENKATRERIDTYRKEKLSSQRKVSSLQEEVDHYKRLAEERNSELCDDLTYDQKRREKIHTLRSKSAHQKSRMSAKVNMLNSKLKEEKQSRSKAFKDFQESFIEALAQPTGTIEITRLLKNLLSYWRKKLGEKKSDLDSYLKNVKLLEGGFKQIEAATGINNKDDIVTAFIKSQDQQYELYSYINGLNSEIDSLEESNKSLLSTIESYETSKESGHKKIRQRSTELQEKLDNYKFKINKKDNKAQKINQELKNLVPIIKGIVETCRNIQIRVDFPSEIELINLEDLTEENTSLILGEVEEYLTKFKLSSNKFQSALPLDLLSEKHFNRKLWDISEELKNAEDFAEEDTQELNKPLPANQIRHRAFAFMQKKYPQAAAVIGNSATTNSSL